jgi:hypothetical protein
MFKILVEEQKCPLYFYKSGMSLPYTTSEGQSVLAIAAQFKRYDIVQYLVVQKHVPMTQVSDLTTLQALAEHFVKNATAGLKRDGPDQPPASTLEYAVAASAPPLLVTPEWERHFDPNTNLHYLYNTLTGETMWEEETTTRDSSDVNNTGKRGGGGGGDGGGGDENECVVCFDKPINSVFVACGHVVCCFECGTTCTACPICRQQSKVVKTFSA